MIRYLIPFAFLFAACGAANGNSHDEAEPSHAGATLIVGNKGDDSISLIDLDTGRERARLPTGEQPHEVTVSPDGSQAAVVSYGGTTIDIFDIARAEKIETVDLTPNSRPHGLVWTMDNRLIATTEGSGTLTIVDMGSREITAIPTGQEGSHMVAVDEARNRAYVSNLGSGTATVIDLEAGEKIADLAVGEAAEGIALTPDGGELWVADRDNAKVVVFDTETLEQTAEIAVGNFPIRLTISPDGATAVTSNYADGSLTLIDVASKQVTRTQTVFGTPQAAQVTILFNDPGDRLYVALTAAGTIAEMDLAEGEILGMLGAADGSDGLAISPVRVERRRRPDVTED